MKTNFPNLAGNSVDYDRLKQTAWKDQGIAILNVDDPDLAWPEREMLKQMATKKYGKRNEAKS